MREEVSKRKVRSDKKRDVKPTISSDLYECISRLSYVLSKPYHNVPMKDIGETICLKGLQSREVMDHLSTTFRRPYFDFGKTIYNGDLNLDQYRVSKRGHTARISLRFTQDDHDRLANLAYSMDLTVSSATALLLESSIKNTSVLFDYIEYFVRDRLTNEEDAELRRVFQYLSMDNPYGKVRWKDIVKFFYEQFMDSAVDLRIQINDWVDKKKSAL